MDNTGQFKRNQLEAALWITLTEHQGNNRQPGPPQVFKTRIKRLLELDRNEVSANDSPGCAFASTPASGKGTDMTYTDFDGFMLALGLEFLDAGFQQRETVYLLQHIRKDLQKQYAYTVKYPSANRNLIGYDESRNLPYFMAVGMKCEDRRVFMLVEKVEMKEIFQQSPSRTPLILKPRYYKGIRDLEADLNAWGWGFRKALILELSQTATQLRKHLNEAPVITRGRH